MAPGDVEIDADGSGGVWRRWAPVFNVVWRVLLVVVGIPAVWVLRAAGVIHLSGWQAVGLSVLLLLIAIGESLLATVWST